MIRLNCCLVAMLLLVGCAGQRPADVATAPAPTVQPTQADKTLAAEFRALATVLADKPVAREQLAWAPEYVQTMLAWLDGTKPATAAQLTDARTWVGNTLVLLKKIQNWPAPPTLDVPRAAGPITVDGKITEPAWDKPAQWKTWYVLNDLTPLAAAEPTTSLRVLWDEKYLYFAFHCQDADLDLAPQPRDGPVYDHDCVELFIQPSERWPLYWELEFGASGSVLDALMFKTKGQFGAHARFDETLQGLQYKALLTGPADKPTGYDVEVAVPLSELPGFASPAQAGYVFRLLACRVNTDTRGRNPRLWTLVPTAVWFHNMDCYARLKLVP